MNPENPSHRTLSHHETRLPGNYGRNHFSAEVGQEIGPVTLQQVMTDHEVRVLIQKADEYLEQVGYTEHGFRHTGLVAKIARNIGIRVGLTPREAELAAIAGYLHDIGNVTGREHHALSGAMLAHSILTRMGMPPEDVAIVMGAIGNHEEDYGTPTSKVAAVLILADKSDVHRSRVRNPNFQSFDIHDRVNYAVEHSFLRVDPEDKSINLELTIDIQSASITEYFSIFLDRMLMCRKAAEFLGWTFNLIANGTRL